MFGKPLRFNGLLIALQQDLERRDIVVSLAAYVRKRYPSWGLTLRSYVRDRRQPTLANQLP